jgi:hypothetical protein
MISPTTYYQTLSQSLSQAACLVEGIDKIACRDDLEHLRLQAFILISHSILEEYLEEVALNAARTSKRRFDENGLVTRALVGLIATRVVDEISDRGRKKISGELAANLELFATEALNSFRNTVTSNHGITTRDQKNLFLPLSIDLELIDIGLSQNLHSFGSKRGDVAHKFKVQREETLSDIEGRLANIKRDLLTLDQEVCSVC